MNDDEADEIAAALDATTPEEWAALEAKLEELERTDPEVGAAAARLEAAEEEMQRRLRRIRDSASDA